MANLLEAYKKRIDLAESVYSKSHNGETMSNQMKSAVALCMNNVSKFLTESLTSAVGTQRADLGLYKKFCVNLTNIALPNLVADNLVMVHPMDSMSGYIAYIKYSASVDKGQTKAGDEFNSPFGLKKVDSTYTSNAVVESVANGDTFTPAFKPVDGKVTFIDKATGAESDLTLTNGSASITADGKVKYFYDNTIVPQEDIPSIKAEMASISVQAKARRIAVYYSQMAAFQSKTDYGFDLGDQLAEQAVGRLAYEIDTEIIELLSDTAGDANADLVWSKTLPVGVNKTEHYEGFAEIPERAKNLIYRKTQRFVPNYMVVASDVIPILSMTKQFVSANPSQINGPYIAGTFNGLKVVVSPVLDEGRFLIGVNGNDYMSSVAVYCPYMTIVPTQLLQFADGGTTQGFSTLYALEVLNKDLIVAGKIVA